MAFEDNFGIARTPLPDRLDKRKPLDASVDITAEDWKGIEDTLGELRQRALFKPDSPWRRFSGLAADIKSIGREPAVHESDWNGIGGMLDAMEIFRQSESDQWKFPLHAAALRRLDAARDIGLIDTDRDLVQRKIEEYRTNGEPFFLSRAGVAMKALFPDTPPLAEADREILASEITKLRASASPELGRLLANAAILFPDNPVPVEAGDWETMQRRRAEMRTDVPRVGHYPWEEFAAQTAAQKHLAEMRGDA